MGGLEGFLKREGNRNYGNLIRPWKRVRNAQGGKPENARENSIIKNFLSLSLCKYGRHTVIAGTTLLPGTRIMSDM